MGYSHMAFLFFFSMLFLSASASSRNLPITAFDEGYTPLFGDNNVFVHRDGKSVHLSLDERTGLKIYMGWFGFCCYYDFVDKVLIFLVFLLLGCVCRFWICVS